MTYVPFPFLSDQRDHNNTIKNAMPIRPPMLVGIPRPEAMEIGLLVEGWVLAGSPTEAVGVDEAAVMTGRDDTVGQLVVV
ncbi:hypothetical protein IFR04_016248 [Cadophora malorum]|uniref:Uncharacterized protein n=1 Tax=Cadophora malorum TaxID=108018 RepID=A0A8H7SZ72_9HELO|nr:hypothetical protein IFR04_016248 [Cadophora malorum]